MNVVAHTGAVGCGVIAAEYRQLFQFSAGDLTDIGQKVVGNTVGLFPDQTGFVCAVRSELAQQDVAPARVGFLDVG